METFKLSEFIENPDNPQTVTDEAFDRLVESVKEDPETLETNKIAYCTDYISPISGKSYVGKRVIVAGNKRLRALKKIHGENAEVNAAWFFDMTPLGIEARRRWLIKSNVQTSEWDVEMLNRLYSAEEIQRYSCDENLNELIDNLQSDMTDRQNHEKKGQSEQVTEEVETRKIAKIFFLVTIPIQRFADFSQKINEIKQMGAEVDEQIG